MSVPERYQQKNSWPHTFARSNNKRELPNGKTVFENYCTHCHKTFWPELESRPIGVCPARKDRTEMKRLLG
jgi:cytochrome c5